MSVRLPSYAVPRKILDLVEDGYFEELTQPGDEVRNFGIVHPSGWTVLLWADREQFERRKRTGFQFGVVKFSPEGEMKAETSGNMLDMILKDYEKVASGVARKYRKRWAYEPTARPAQMEWR